jgi:hypothetical protein
LAASSSDSRTFTSFTTLVVKTQCLYVNEPHEREHIAERRTHRRTAVGEAARVAEPLLGEDWRDDDAMR